MKILKRTLALSLLAFFALPFFAGATTYVLDTTFNTGSGFNNTVHNAIQLPDGKLLLVGRFATYNGSSSNGVVKLNLDGTIDTSFNYGTGFTGGTQSVSTLLYTSTGKIRTSGSFTNYNGTARNHVIGLNLDGTVDAGFGGNLSPIGNYGAAEQPDGKIVWFGNTLTVNGTTVGERLYRTNANGTLDATFNTLPTGLNHYAWDGVVQADGKVVVVGMFTAYNGATVNRIMRVNTDGSLDTTFNSGGSGFNSHAMDIIQQPDGKLIVGGYFTSYNGTTANRIIRLNADGSIDSTFNSGTGFDSYVSYYNRGIALQSDGKILAVGGFTTYNGVSRNRLVRINTDGSLDTTFELQGTGINLDTNTVIPLSDGRIFISGSFTSYNGTTANRAAILKPLGTIAPTVAPDMTAGTDTGSSNTDNITNDTTPDFTGVCVNGETVTLYVDGTAIAPTQICSGGVYTITPSSPIANGSHTIRATFNDGVNGESSFSPALSFTIDNQAPAAFTASINPLGAFSFTNPQFTFSTTDQTTITYSVSQDGGPFVTVTSPYVPGTALDPAVPHHFIFRACDEFGACTDSHLYFYPSITVNAPTVISNTTITDTTITIVEPTSSINYLDTASGTISYNGGAPTPVTLTCVPVIPGTGTEKTTNCTVDGGIGGADGTYLLSLTAYNNAAIPGFGQSSQLYTIDTIAPGLTINAPTKVKNSAITNTTVTLTDANGIDSVNVTGGTLGTCTPALPTSQTNVSVTCDITISASGNLDVTVFDLAGNSTNAVENNYVIDPIAPVIGTVSVPSGATFGVNKTITFTVTDNYGILPAGVSATSGSTSCTAVNATTLNCSLAIMSGSVTVNATDIATNSAIPSALTYTLILPIADIATTSDNGISNTDNITNDNTPTFSGVCADGETVTLFIDTNPIMPSPYTFTEVCSGGVYNITPSPALADGSYTAEIQYSLGSDVSTMSPVLNFTVDTVAPVTTITSHTTATVAYNQTTTIEGACTTADGDVTVNGITTPCILGQYSVSVPSITNPFIITASQADTAGNTTSQSVTLTQPGAVVILTPVPISGGGVTQINNSNTNQTTNTNFTPSSNPGKTYISPIDNKEKLCPGFTQYLRKGSSGGEVKLLQAFLNKKLNKTIPLTNYFGNQTESAVREYQLLNKSTVMTPWGLTSPTGWWYQSTRFQANKDITCSEGTVKLDNGVVIKD